MFKLLLRTTMLTCALTAPVHAQSGYPIKPLTIVVPFQAGGGSDTLARATGHQLSEVWGTQVLIENRPGANTIIGTEHAAHSQPDGYTLLLTERSLILNASLYQKLPYDPFADFAPITQLTNSDFVLVVSNKLPVTSIQELIALAKSKPGAMSYASFGIGSSAHVIGEMFQDAAGIKLNHIPYKGTAPALVDIASGNVQMMFSSLGPAVPQWKAGKLKVLGVGGTKPLPEFPTLPTLNSAGLPGFEATVWLGLFAPARTPRAVIDKINADVRKIYADREFRFKALDPQGFEPMTSSPEQFASYIKSDGQRWAKVVRDAKIKLD